MDRYKIALAAEVTLYENNVVESVVELEMEDVTVTRSSALDLSCPRTLSRISSLLAKFLAIAESLSIFLWKPIGDNNSLLTALLFLTLTSFDITVHWSRTREIFRTLHLWKPSRC